MNEHELPDLLNMQQTAELGNLADTDGKYLSFWTDTQLFGVPISDVVQIIGVQSITELPESPSYVKGVINLRGNIFPVIDARIRLGKAEKPYDERTCIIVTNIREQLMGFVVDAVDEVTSIANEEISTPPQFGQDCQNAYLTGISKKDERVILLIDTKKLLGEADLTNLFAAMEEDRIQ